MPCQNGSCEKGLLAGISYQEVLSRVLEEMVGPHPLESRPSELPGLLTLTALQTTANKPGRIRKAKVEDEEWGASKINKCSAIIIYFPN